MTQIELNIFKTNLTSKCEELLQSLRRREGIAIVRTADALDETHLAAERELNTRNLERGSNVLRDVQAALDRMADGMYSTCLDCGEEISKKRLLAVPWATLCVPCQERADRNPGLASQERILRDAA